MKKFFKFFLSILRSYAESLFEAFQENEYTQEFKEQYPRVFRFVRNRLSPREYLGLHLTIGFFVAVYLSVQFVQLTSALFRDSELTRIDTNIITFLTTVRTGALMKPMLFFTALGNWPMVAFVTLFFATLWIWQKRWFRVGMLFLTVVGSELLAVLLKIFVARERPDPSAALLIETTYSFPSGHAMIALALYGFLAYSIMRASRSFVRRIGVMVFACAVILAIGVSRIYLGVHWPSDVFGGYLLALFWIAIVATAAEVHHRFVLRRPVRQKIFFPLRWIVPLLVLWGVAAIVYVVGFVERPHFQPSAVHRAIPVGNIEEHRTVSDEILDVLPDVSEGLTGRQLEPISLVLIGNDAAMRSVFTRAGWLSAETFTLRSSWETIIRALRNRPYPTAPISPAFIYSRPQDSAWQKPTEKNSARERHHVRLWKDASLRVEGKDVWVGTASFDAGVKLTSRVRIPTHRIAPAIDVERDFVVADLEGVGTVAAKEIIQRYDPFLGTNALGDPFFTDGKVVIISLK